MQNSVSTTTTPATITMCLQADSTANLHNNEVDGKGEIQLNNVFWDEPN